KTLNLVSQAVQGDREALNDLYRLYEHRLEKAVHFKLGRRLRGRMETADLIQSVWKDVLADVHGFEYRGKDSFFRWLSVRIIRKVQDKVKYFAVAKRDPAREQRMHNNGMGLSSESPPAIDLTPSQAAMADEERARIERLLDLLPDEQQQVILLRMKNGATFEEIGKQTGVSGNTARKRYVLGMDKLGDLLGEDGRGEEKYKRSRWSRNAMTNALQVQ
ncbi:MAG: sigma-70 family RNA polymerase sigma factor, partial [Planctomycetes bacterium]|nr:sigma-70 family RNA polymerase sigma factor [Planctomycetota bacterium]